MDRPGMLMPDVGLIIGLLLLGGSLIVAFAAPAINRWLDKL